MRHRRRSVSAGPEPIVTAPIAIALLGAITTIAIIVAAIATRQARSSRAALHAIEAAHAERAELAEMEGTMATAGRLAGDIAHDLNDLLTAITGHTELLIANLDPSGTSILDAYEIRTAALSAARLTRPLRSLCGGRGSAGIGPAIDLPPSEQASAPDAKPVETPVLAPVLVVEDEPGVRELITVILQRAGHPIVEVAGPHAALAALRRQPALALMLVDVVMPEMDGYDLVAEARLISPGIHVVFMSAFARDSARHSSGDGFLAKPFTADALIAIVTAALEG